MSCTRPLAGYRGPNGKLVFSRRQSPLGQLMTVPCGGCLGCKMQRSKDWAVRCWHEAETHGPDENAFVTLTYDDENLPYPPTVSNDVHQKFIRALRDKTGLPIRYFMCGEYGDQYARPHYHYLLFGFQFPDLYPWETINGNTYYRSELLEEVWTHGYSNVTEVTLSNAGYVARYIFKKFKDAEPTAVDPRTGEDLPVEPEFIRMSLKPGIGENWWRKYGIVLKDRDFIVIDGQKYKVPRYYDKLLEREDPEALKALKQKRILTAQENPDNQDWRRMMTKEEILQLRLDRLVRGYEVKDQGESS